MMWKWNQINRHHFRYPSFGFHALTQKKQLTAGSPFADRMNVQLLNFDGDHLLGDNAMHRMAPRPAALFRLAGKSPRRCPALLNAPSAAHSGTSNCFF
jgi:hypothetical protein